jgi:hypothetical protein
MIAQGASPDKTALFVFLNQEPHDRSGTVTGGIFLLQDDNQLIEMLEQPYDSEIVLQKLLEDHPNLLAGSQINPTEPRRWLLVSREMNVPLDENYG